MVDYMLLDGMTDGVVARVMGWPIKAVHQRWREVAENGRAQFHRRKQSRAREKIAQRALRYERRFGRKEAA